jgi:hypothetical protein
VLATQPLSASSQETPTQLTGIEPRPGRRPPPRRWRRHQRPDRDAAAARASDASNGEHHDTRALLTGTHRHSSGPTTPSQRPGDLPAAAGHTQLPSGRTPAPPDDGRSTADQQFSSCRCCTSRAGGTAHVRIRLPIMAGRRHRHVIGRWVHTDWAAQMRPRWVTDGRADQSAGLDRGGSRQPQRTPPRRPDTNVSDLRSTGPNRNEPGRKSGAVVDNISNPLDAVLQTAPDHIPFRE